MTPCTHMVSMATSMQVEGIGNIHLKLKHNVVIIFHNVKHVLGASLNLISMGELTSHQYKYAGLRKWCYKGNHLILRGEKDKKNICRLIGCLVLGTINDTMTVRHLRRRNEFVFRMSLKYLEMSLRV